jgi:MFS transporter, AAHS family, 3-hydroxyphenylpropionic acid transporter
MQRARLTLLLCFAVALMEGLDLQAGGLTAPAIRHELALSLGQMTTFLTASTLGLFLGAIVGGRLSDLIARQSVLMVSVAVFGAFSITTALCHGATELTFARLLTGTGIGGALPNLIALCADNAPPNARKKWVAWVFAGVPLGGGIASTISYTVGATNWRALYYCGGVLPLLLVPLFFFRPGRSALPLRQAGPTQLPKIASALFGDGRLLTTITLWIAFCLMQLTSHLLLNWLPTLMVSRGFDSSHAALIQIAYGVIGAAGCGVVGLMLSRFDARVVAIGVGGWLVVMLVLLATFAQTFAAVIICTGLASAGMMGCLVVNYASAPLVYPTLVRGTGVGMAVAIGRIGSIVGPLLGGLLIGSYGSFGRVLAAIVPLVLIGALCSAAVIFWADRLVVVPLQKS